MDKINVELDRHYYNRDAATIHVVVVEIFPKDGGPTTKTEVLFATAKGAENYAEGVKDALAMNSKLNERGGYVSPQGSIAHVTTETKVLL
jgi:hypothetical protein